jgi:hypothetical protein
MQSIVLDLYDMFDFDPHNIFYNKGGSRKYHLTGQDRQTGEAGFFVT